MAQVEVKVPQLSESVSEATLVAWKKKAGEAVKRDENLIDIETDKVVLELPAPADGVLAKIVKKDGESVTSGDLIAMIDTEAKATVSAAAPSKEAAAQPAAAVAPAAAASAATPAQAGGKAASPSAAKIAAEKGVDTSTVQGTGRDGRVTKGDVLAAGSAPAAAPAPAQARPTPAIQIPSGSRTEQRVPMSRLRQRVAERLVQSQATAAILTTFNEVNMAPVIEIRNRYKERFEKEHGVKLGFMSFFVKAAVHALRKYPIVNASIDGTDIVYHGYYDVGIAVAVTFWLLRWLKHPPLFLRDVSPIAAGICAGLGVHIARLWLR